MEPEHNKDVVRRFIAEVLSGGRLDRVDELCGPGYVNRAEELIAEADAVVARFTFDARDAGGKATSVRGLTYYRLAGGRIVEDDPITTPELTEALGPLLAPAHA